MKERREVGEGNEHFSETTGFFQKFVNSNKLIRKLMPPPR